MKQLFGSEKRFAIFGSIAALFAGAFPLIALGEEEAAPASAPASVATPVPGRPHNVGVMPESRTLPERVLRLRLPLKYATASSGFDESGNKLDLGLNLKLLAGAFVAEYGITDQLSLQFLVPILYSNKMGLDGNQFRKSQKYKANYNVFVEKVADLLRAQGLCDSAANCIQLVESGYALPYDTPVTLPTGEVLTAKAGVPVKMYADSLVVGQGMQEEGKTGIGDVEIGALYMFSNGTSAPLIEAFPFDAAIGLGVRLPTGSFKDVPGAYRATGRGTTDVAVRTNLDYNPVSGVYLSHQNQFEVMVLPGKKQRTSYLDDAKLNKANATTKAAKDAGADGYKNEEEYTRVGSRNFGFLKVGLGLGSWVEEIKFWNVSAKWAYDMDARTNLGGRLYAKAPESTTVVASTTLSTVPYVADGEFPIPVDLDFDYEMPLTGKNKTVAASVFSSTLKIYYKF